MGPSLVVHYFDGQTAASHRVTLSVDASEVVIEGDGVALRIRGADIAWPERRSHGARVAHLPGGGSLHTDDGAAWDAWAEAVGMRDSWVVRAQQSWRITAWSAAALVLVGAALFVWGVPLVARIAVSFVPAQVEQQIGDAIHDAMIDDQWIEPTTLGADEVEALQQRLDAAVRRAYATADIPPYRLSIAKSRLGPNAYALPGGRIVLTEELYALLRERDQVLLGVLAHELGHVRGRHGMRSVAQFAALGIVMGVAYGDYSTVLAAAPALAAQMAYSRDFEREADDESIRVLRANGIEPGVMVALFDALDAQQRKEASSDAAGARGDAGFDILFASHPADDERRARFRAASR